MPRRKKLERPVDVAEQRFEHIIQSLEEGVVAVDSEGRIVSMNQAAEQITGCSFLAASAQHHSLVFQRDPWVSQLIEQVSPRDRGIRADGEISGRWGRSSPARASASPILDPHGRWIGAVLILQDLTLQVELESDLRRAQSLSHLSLVVAGLAHEIKNPLGGIRGAVQLLGAELESGSKLQEYVTLVLREVDRLTKLLERLLQLGSRGRPEARAVNLHRVVEHVLSLVEDEAKQGGVRILRYFDPSLPPVAAEHDSLVQVLLNLVQNSLQAVALLPPGAARELRFSTRIETDYHLEPSRRAASPPPRGRFLRVEVEDNGPGIPDDLKSKLFSPFFTSKVKGTGLGLAISHRIVTDHGGTIRFESEPGRTIFRVILPAWDRSLPAELEDGA